MSRIVVIGDALLDVDIDGTATRLVPDEPAPVVDISNRWFRPGGAGLAAALMATRCGCDVTLVAAFGADPAGRRLIDLLAPDLRVLQLPLDGTTPTKTRIRASGRTITRLDDGTGRAATLEIATRVSDVVRAADAVLVADYGRGVPAHPGIRALLEENVGKVPVVWDPHPRGLAPIAGCSMITPNLAEARGFADRIPADQLVVDHRGAGRGAADHLAADHLGADHLGADHPRADQLGADHPGTDHRTGDHRKSGHRSADDDSDHDRSADHGAGTDRAGQPRVDHRAAGRGGEAGALAAALLRHWRAGSVAVTTGSAGAVLAMPDTDPVVVPVPPPAAPVADGPETCGAGDRFAGAVTAALATGSDPVRAVRIGVRDAGRFVAIGGAAELNTAEDEIKSAPAVGLDAFELAEHVRRRGGRLVAAGGCFDLLHPGHLTLLRRARELGDALVVCVNSDESVRRLKGPNRPVNPIADRVRMLLELGPVDAVAVFDESDPAELLSRLRPDIWVKGDQYADRPIPEAATVRRYGGDVVLLPTVAGYSTTRLLQEVTARCWS